MKTALEINPTLTPKGVVDAMERRYSVRFCDVISKLFGILPDDFYKEIGFFSPNNRFTAGSFEEKSARCFAAALMLNLDKVHEVFIDDPERLLDPQEMFKVINSPEERLGSVIRLIQEGGRVQ